MASRIVRFCCTHISQHGPCTGDELYAAARAAAVTAARSPASLLSPLRNDPRVVVRPDGRYDAAARLLAGTVLTHRSGSRRAGTASCGPDGSWLPSPC